MSVERRIALDGSVLPVPINGTEDYLAAIFDELRALRLQLSALAANAQPTDSTEEPDAVVVAEPASIACTESTPASAGSSPPRRRSSTRKRK